MTGNLEELSGIAAPARVAVRAWLGMVHEVAGNHALAVTVFGPAVGGPFDAECDGVQSVLVLDRVDLGLLRRLAECGPRMGKLGVVAPLIMTPAYIRASLDTFPLEFIEIQAQHVTPLGPDYFADLAFEDADVRLQCERELKSVLISMRQGLLAAAGRPQFIGPLSAQISQRVLRTLRGLLWLRRTREALPAAAVLEAVETLTQRKLPGLRRGTLPATHEHPGWNDFDQLYRDIETLGELADAW
ncbi:MAG TPA: hypothetical protein PKK06_02125 [Phycisphaerae bacterium]|nr:hypothetical protein [Phycisphaerae bacterium]HNU44077.1 hypothetical protein [Phycisphaerae bacterium]